MALHPALAWIRGLTMADVSHDAECHSWWFGFARHGGIQVFSPWRIVREGRVALASGDHLQQYGLPAPIDAVREATGLLAARTVEDVIVDPASGDLEVRFTDGGRLQTFSDSRGYEMWHLVSPDDRMFVGQGGRVSAIRWDGQVGHAEPLE